MIRTKYSFAALLAMLLLCPAVNAQNLGTAFVYQGRLTDAGAPVNGTRSMTFRLHSHATNAAPVGTPVTIPAMTITDGLLNATLDFGADAINGDARWLEITVEGVTLSPRQRLAPAPNALALPGLRTQQNADGSHNIIGGHRVNSITGGVVGATIAGGGLLSYPNRIEGHYSTIGGGAANSIIAVQSTIGGGVNNTITIDGFNSTIAGGNNNTASGFISTVAGGAGNTAAATYSTVGGGTANIASGQYSVVPGGIFNASGGDYSFAAGRQAKVRTPAQSNDSDGDEGTFAWADSTPADFVSTGPNQFLIRASGGVGINTNSPLAPLHIVTTSDAGLWLARSNGPVMKINPEVSVVGLNPGNTTVAAQITNRPLGHLVLDISANDAGDSFAVRTDANFDGTVDTIAMTVKPSGNVGIGTTSPDAKLSVNGSANKPGGGTWSTYSDARLKHDVTPLEGSLDRLLRLRGVSFVYNDPKAINELPGRRIGMVAQEVERVFPDWVETGASGYKSVTFRGFEALTVESLRELKAENARLRQAIELRDAAASSERHQLRQELNELRAAVAEFKKMQGR